MIERMTPGDRTLLRRLDNYFATEIARAERDFDAVDTTQPTSLRVWQSSHSFLRFAGVFGVFVALVIVIAPSLGFVSLPFSSGSLPTSAPPGRGDDALNLSAVVVDTADGVSIVRLDGNVVELLVVSQTGGTWTLSVVDRTLRVPSNAGTAARDTNAWYAVGNALVCDAASGLRDRGFIYGWLAADPRPVRVELSGIPVRGDGRLVDGLYLYVVDGTPEAGASYALTPFAEPSIPPPIQQLPMFGVPAPVTCGAPPDAGSARVLASIEDLLNARPALPGRQGP